MASDVLYARVPRGLKQAAEDHATARNLTIAAAVAELLRVGVEAESNATKIKELELEIARLRQDVEIARAERDAEVARGGAAAQKIAVLAGVSQGWSDRAQQVIGACPNEGCDQPIKGVDLLVSGTCPSCKKAIGSMFRATKASSRTDWDTLLPILIAGGVVLAAVAATRGRP